MNYFRCLKYYRFLCAVLITLFLFVGCSDDIKKSENQHKNSVHLTPSGSLQYRTKPIDASSVDSGVGGYLCDVGFGFFDGTYLVSGVWPKIRDASEKPGHVELHCYLEGLGGKKTDSYYYIPEKTPVIKALFSTSSEDKSFFWSYYKTATLQNLPGVNLAFNTPVQVDASIKSGFENTYGKALSPNALVYLEKIVIPHSADVYHSKDANNPLLLDSCHNSRCTKVLLQHTQHLLNAQNFSSQVAPIKSSAVDYSKYYSCRPDSSQTDNISIKSSLDETQHYVWVKCNLTNVQSTKGLIDLNAEKYLVSKESRVVGTLFKLVTVNSSSLKLFDLVHSHLVEVKGFATMGYLQEGSAVFRRDKKIVEAVENKVPQPTGASIWQIDVSKYHLPVGTQLYKYGADGVIVPAMVLDCDKLGRADCLTPEKVK